MSLAKNLSGLGEMKPRVPEGDTQTCREPKFKARATESLPKLQDNKCQGTKLDWPLGLNYEA